VIAERALIVGFGITGEAMARALAARGAEVLAVDDHPSPERRRRAELAGVHLLEAPDREQWRTLVEGRSAVLPTPGLPESHPVFAEAARAAVPVLSEFDLAAAWDDRPVLAITGTNGKTTVTMMVTDMMNASGRAAVAVGNTDTPLVAAIDDPDIDVFVVEASSFRLGATQRFVPAAATWLNFAPDHLDVHTSLERYEQAKARIWSDLDAEHGTAIANADDEVVMRNRNPRARTLTYGLGERSTVDFGVDGEQLLAPGEEPLVRSRELFRALPHDIGNALAASATALAGGATIDGVREVLRTFAGLPHRVELVGERDGVRWYDDSKATAPHATIAAVTGFASVVLIAGGRNKGLDLSPLGELAPHVRAVVAIGEATDDVVAAFAGRRPTTTATSMAEAVDQAASLARPGDAVVLSPGCASFDWFTSYGHRGDVFAAEVRRLLGELPA
jgi:UDP-N-acetylmuramoylalanine--D-glutamate ligase